MLGPFLASVFYQVIHYLFSFIPSTMHVGDHEQNNIIHNTSPKLDDWVNQIISVCRRLLKATFFNLFQMSSGFYIHEACIVIVKSCGFTVCCLHTDFQA
jgi:hypothetical protein